ncbi:hypothetical protein EOD39_6919 [Acipenser ruthenus]|uniref:Uncharacterized protein n=1 Tax=Acipenser ruthenus TaxID=7906 RepID=A0A662YXE9_ACIRT|nr:hypothetical protein EOD39_6919 [Acipenser ruthenus]
MRFKSNSAAWRQLIFGRQIRISDMKLKPDSSVPENGDRPAELEVAVVKTMFFSSGLSLNGQRWPQSIKSELSLYTAIYLHLYDFILTNIPPKADLQPSKNCSTDPQCQVFWEFGRTDEMGNAVSLDGFV